MTASDLMSTPAATCRQDTSLADTAALFRDRDCGFMPVLDANDYVAGVVTDRDLAIAVADADQPWDELTAGRAMTGPAHTCLPADSVADALQTMSRFRVRRLPVVDRDGRLLGVISLDDIARAHGRAGAPPATAVVEALARICGRRLAKIGAL